MNLQKSPISTKLAKATLECAEGEQTKRSMHAMAAWSWNELIWQFSYASFLVIFALIFPVVALSGLCSTGWGNATGRPLHDVDLTAAGARDSLQDMHTPLSFPFSVGPAQV